MCIIYLNYINVICLKLTHEWSQTAISLMAGLSSFVLCVSRVNSLSGCFLTAGSVDNDGALCWPPNQCCFSHISLGWTDLITQRCCILNCAVKYSCHAVGWWVMIFDHPPPSTHTSSLHFWICDSNDSVHRWSTGAPVGRTNDIKLFSP